MRNDFMIIYLLGCMWWCIYCFYGNILV